MSYDDPYWYTGNDGFTRCRTCDAGLFTCTCTQEEADERRARGVDYGKKEDKKQ